MSPSSTQGGHNKQPATQLRSSCALLFSQTVRSRLIFLYEAPFLLQVALSVWNSLEPDLRSVASLASFKSRTVLGNISTALCTLAFIDIHWKFHGYRPRGTPPPGELNTRGVAKYSGFGPIDAISRKRCKIGGKLVLVTNRKSYNIIWAFDWY